VQPSSSAGVRRHDSGPDRAARALKGTATGGPKLTNKCCALARSLQESVAARQPGNNGHHVAAGTQETLPIETRINKLSDVARKWVCRQVSMNLLTFSGPSPGVAFGALYFPLAPLFSSGPTPGAVAAIAQG